MHGGIDSSSVQSAEKTGQSFVFAIR